MITTRQKLLISLTVVMVLLLLAGLLLPLTVSQAQPGATLQAQANAIQATAQAQATEFADRRGALTATLGAFQENLNATLEAAQADVESVVGEIEARATEVAATVQYIATTLNQQGAALQATATAISLQIEAQLNTLPPGLLALLESLYTQAIITYDQATNALTVTSLVTEPQANELIDILVEAAGYDPAAITLDLQADRTVQIVLVDVTAQLAGTLVLTYEPTLIDGRVNLTLVGVTLNDNSIRLDQVPADLQSAVQLGVVGAAQQTALNVPAAGYGYTIDSLSVTADHFILTYTIALG